MSSDLLQVFVELGNLHGTSNYVLYSMVTCSDSVSHNRVKIHSKLSSRTHMRWFRKLLRRQSSGGCRFNLDCRRVTIQEYLTLILGSKFRVGSQVRQTPENGRGTYRPKRCENNNKVKTIV